VVVLVTAEGVHHTGRRRAAQTRREQTSLYKACLGHEEARARAERVIHGSEARQSRRRRLELNGHTLKATTWGGPGCRPALLALGMRFVAVETNLAVTTQLVRFGLTKLWISRHSNSTQRSLL